jgi:hypothetical protein
VGPLFGLGLLAVLALAPPARGEPPRPAEAAKPPVAAAAPAASPAAPSAPSNVEPPKRAKVTCAQYRAIADENAKHAVFNTRLKAGSWGTIPPELRKLPKGAKLCGVDKMGQVAIASTLFGKEIEDHYNPLFAKVDFEPLTCKVTETQTQCHSKRHRDIGIVLTDAKSQAYILSVMRRGPAKPLSATGHDR